MTELPPDIPPWSPLADRGRATAGATTLEPPQLPDEAAPEQPDTGGAPRRNRSAAVLWVLAGGLVGLVVAAAVLAVWGEEQPAPTTTTLVRAPLPATSADDPAPMGTRVALGNGWTVAVRGFADDTTRALRPYNRDRTLDEDDRYVLVDLEMSYIDGRRDAESPFYGVDLAVVGGDGVAITPSDGPCTAPDPVIDMDAELARGSTERGRICFAVPADQLGSLRLTAEPSMIPGADTSWFALGAPDTEDADDAEG